jgi:hypothetical protein
MTAPVGQSLPGFESPSVRESNTEGLFCRFVAPSSGGKDVLYGF